MWGPVIEACRQDVARVPDPGVVDQDIEVSIPIRQVVNATRTCVSSARSSVSVRAASSCSVLLEVTRLAASVCISATITCVL
jgi:uncharacterized protein (UPF0147 family)